jgi:hypothetical protein
VLKTLDDLLRHSGTRPSGHSTAKGLEEDSSRAKERTRLRSRTATKLSRRRKPPGRKSRWRSRSSRSTSKRPGRVFVGSAHSSFEVKTNDGLSHAGPRIDVATKKIRD